MPDESEKTNVGSSNSMSIKELREAELLEAQRIALNRKHYFNIIKLVLFVAGTIIAFLIIQKPESFLKQKSSKEKIAKERALLVLDLLKEKDPEKIALGIEAIKAAYPADENDWLNRFRLSVVIQSNDEKIKNALKNYTLLTETHKSLKNDLEKLKRFISPISTNRKRRKVTRRANGSITNLSKLTPEEIKKKIQEIKTKTKFYHYKIREQKSILASFGVTINDTDDWEGDWYISWEGEEQIWYEMDELKEPLTFEFRDGILIGKYGYRTKDGIVNGEIKDIKISDNCLKGHYYEKGGGEDGNGTVEFLMFPERKDAFIGRYKRRKSTLLNVDDNYKIWIGKRRRVVK
jgi:hypothetical protein